MTDTSARDPEVVLVRHGATEWSDLGRHTGRTDLDLNDDGRAAARRARRRARPAGRSRSCSSARCADRRKPRASPGSTTGARCTTDLCEWDYGDYEGRTTAEIRAEVPAWTVWSHPVPGGETADEVGARIDRVIERARRPAATSPIFGHGHALRVFGARWCRMPPTDGRILALDPASVSVLGYERETPVIRQWNWVPTVR